MKPRSVSACVREIRKINARFRKLKKQDGPLAGRLATRKDALISEMEAVCRHPQIVATRGGRIIGGLQGPKRIHARRICVDCGAAAARRSLVPGPKKLFRIRAEAHVGLPEYLIIQGEILRRLGINL